MMPGRPLWAKQVVRRRNGKCAVGSGTRAAFGGTVRTLLHTWCFIMGFSFTRDGFSVQVVVTFWLSGFLSSAFQSSK